VREILKVAERPDVISFAGGLPAPELFPVQEFAEAHARVFTESGAAAMQYSTTEGWGPLREWVADRMRKRGIATNPDCALITSGSQQGIDLAAKVFIDQGDVVIVENPCYLAALQAFGAYGASFVAVDSDDEGMRVDQVEEVLKRSDAKLIYIVSDFHNPKGTSLSLERKKKLIELSSQYKTPIVEDDPYAETRFTGELPPPLASLDEDGLVIYLSTFSKTLSPGMRIGWAVASKELMRAMIVAKQASDLHTSTIQQRAAALLLESFDYDGHIAKIRKVYEERCHTMLAAIEDHFPAGSRTTKPEGGLFVWAELPDQIIDEKLLEEALRQKVAFVPGAPFFAENTRHNFARLNFSNSQPEVIFEGIRRLGDAMKGMLE
jgi:2-aminoadipate transaminase